MTNTQTAEIVTFRLNPGVSDADFLTAIQATERYTNGATGFMSRQLSKADDGTWTDYVVWASLHDAQAAAAGFAEQDFAPTILQAIDKDSFSMRHQPVLWAPPKAA